MHKLYTDQKTKITLILITVLLSYSYVLKAQWSRIQGPDELHNAKSLLEGDNGRIFMSSSGGFYYSDDFGDQWLRVPTGNNHFTPKIMRTPEGKIYAVDMGALYVSDDNGASWPSPTYANWEPMGYHLTDAGVMGDTVYLGGTKGLYYQVRSTYELTRVTKIEGLYVSDIHVAGNYIFVSTESYIFISEDRGKSWKNITIDKFPPFMALEVTYANGTIYCINSSTQNILYSEDLGTTWKVKDVNEGVITAIDIEGGNMFAVTSDSSKVFVAPLATLDFTQVSKIEYFRYGGHKLLVSNNKMLAGGWNGLYKSENGGVSWTSAIKGVRDAFIDDLQVDGNGTIVGTSTNNGMYAKKSNTSNFSPLYLTEGGYISSPFISDKVYFVQDFTLTAFDAKTSTITERIILPSEIFPGRDIIKKDGEFFLRTDNNGLFKYTKEKNWVKFNEGLASSNINQLILSNGIFYAATEDGLFRRKLTGSTWEKVQLGTYEGGVVRVVIKGNKLIVNTRNFLTIYSEDDGKNFKEITALNNYYLQGAKVFGNTLYVYNGGNIKFSNDLKTWTTLKSDDYTTFNSFVVARDTIFASAFDGDILAFNLKAPYFAAEHSAYTQCMGNEIKVDVAIRNIEFKATNRFNLQLSDDQGSFDNAITIGSVKGKYISSIKGKIPQSLMPNRSHKLRVVASDGNRISHPSSDIWIAPKPLAEITVDGTKLYSSPGLHYQWYRDGKAISDTTQSIIATKSGKYSVEVRGYFCPSLSAPVDINIPDPNSQEKVIFYPNPFSSTITLQLSKDLQNATITIVDKTGKVLRTFKTKELILSLDLSKLCDGFYYLQVQSCKQKIIKRIEKRQ